MTETFSARPRTIVALAVVIIAGLVAAAALWAKATRPVRETLAAYTALITAANRQDIASAESLCSDRYRGLHRLRPAAEGGIVGLPRNIHKNFQAWRQGTNVWICPTNRVGPVYQFVREQGQWRFDGPVGLLRGRNELIMMPDLTDDSPPSPASNSPQPD